MPKLPNKYNPFFKTEVYSKLNIDPSTPAQELKKVLDKFSPKSLKTEDEDDRDSVKKSVALLKHSFTRVVINALILERVELKKIKERLKEVPNLKGERVRLPKPGLSQIHIEGQSVEISEKDFNPIRTDPALELDFDEVKNHLTQQKLDYHHYFET